MKPLATRTMRWDKNGDQQALLSREWLVTNGIGGFASVFVTASFACMHNPFLKIVVRH